MCARVTTKRSVRTDRRNTTPRNADGSRPCNTIPSPRTNRPWVWVPIAVVRRVSVRYKYACIWRRRRVWRRNRRARASPGQWPSDDRRRTQTETVQHVPRGPVLNGHAGLRQNGRAPGGRCFATRNGGPGAERTAILVRNKNPTNTQLPELVYTYGEHLSSNALWPVPNVPGCVQICPSKRPSPVGRKYRPQPLRVTHACTNNPRPT